MFKKPILNQTPKRKQKLRKILLSCMFVLCLAVMLSACKSDSSDMPSGEPVDEPADSPAEVAGLPPANNPANTPAETPAQEPEVVPEEPLVYIALGDSVPMGYGLNSLDDRYTSIFFEMLENDGYANEYVNMAVNGLTSATLLQLLSNMDDHGLDLFQNASVISLNIGGNNILLPFIAHMPDAEGMDRVLTEAMDFANEAEEVINDILNFVAQSQDTIAGVLDFASEVMDIANNFSISDVFRIRELLERASSVLEDTIEVFDKVTALESDATEVFEKSGDLELLSVISLLSGTFPPGLDAELDRGVRAFSGDFAGIIAWLKDNAPNATIIVNTVYNPIPTRFFGIPLNFSNRSDILIQSINQIIYDGSGGSGYIVSDIYSGLSDELEMMNISLDIVHPNHVGHSLIAQINYDDFLQHAG